MKVAKSPGRYSTRTHNNIDVLIQNDPHTTADDVIAMPSFHEEFKASYDPKKAEKQAERDQARRLIRRARDKQGVREYLDWEDEEGVVRFACTVTLEDEEILERQAERVEVRIHGELRKLEKIDLRKGQLAEARENLEKIRHVSEGEFVERTGHPNDEE